MSLNDNDVLEHFGVLGMKWGVRKGSSVSSEHARMASIKKKKASELSDSELKTALARIKLEKEYKDLTKKPKSEVVKFVENLAKQSVANAIGNTLQGLVKTALDSALETGFGKVYPVDIKKK